MKYIIIILIILGSLLYSAVKIQNYFEDKRITNCPAGSRKPVMMREYMPFLLNGETYNIERGMITFDLCPIPNYWGFIKEFPFFTTNTSLIKEATIQIYPNKL